MSVGVGLECILYLVGPSQVVSSEKYCCVLFSWYMEQRL